MYVYVHNSESVEYFDYTGDFIYGVTINNLNINVDVKINIVVFYAVYTPDFQWASNCQKIE